LASTPGLPDAFTGRGVCEIVLDSECAEAAAPASADGYRGKLAWMPKGSPLRPAEMTEDRIVAHAIAIAKFVAGHHIDVVLSPSHLLGQQGEPLLQVDVRACIALRAALDESGQSHVAVDYALLAPVARLGDPNWRAEVCRRLASLPFRQLWVRAGPFGIGHGRSLGVMADALADFRALGRPVVLDHAGGLTGLAPVIFGLADAVCHGVGSRLDSDFLHWSRKPSSGPPSAGGRRDIYHPALDRMISASEHRALDGLKARQRQAFSCVQNGCCDSDADVLAHKNRHFLRQVADLHQGLLTSDTHEGQRRLHKRLWEGERTIKSSLHTLDDGLAGHRLLAQSLADIELLRQALPSAAGGKGDRKPLAFHGRDPANRALLLRPSPAPRSRRRPDPGPDLFEDARPDHDRHLDGPDWR
jgi:hypothetical protein